MTITIKDGRVYFVYADRWQANEAFDRLKHLRPHICSQGGYFNALVVDLDKVQPMGEG